MFGVFEATDLVIEIRFSNAVCILCASAYVHVPKSRPPPPDFQLTT
jgi:hypothetical protein